MTRFKIFCPGSTKATKAGYVYTKERKTKPSKCVGCGVYDVGSKYVKVASPTPKKSVKTKKVLKKTKRGVQTFSAKKRVSKKSK